MKRANNEGTIFKRPNGRWRAQVTIDGRRLSHTGNTKEECAQWLRKMQGQVEKGMTYQGANTILKDFFEEWLKTIKNSLRENSWEYYRYAIEKYAIPGLGRYKLKDLKTAHIQHLYNSLIDKGVGAHTVIKLHAILHKALAYTVATGMVGYNPASAAVPPKNPHTEMQIYDESQVSSLLIAAKGTRLEALLHLAIATGMRQMELLGLMWTDLDWVKQSISVQRQLTRSGGFASPKTRFGIRIIALGDRTIEVLRAHLERQQFERQFFEKGWKETGLIFTNLHGSPMDPRNLVRDYRKIQRDAGLPEIRFHDLRHTAASLMLNKGVSPLIVSRRLGHSRPSITLDIYGHLIPSLQEEAARMIDEIITPVEIET
jgi:integrase